jgi:hypothetical protein
MADDPAADTDTTLNDQITDAIAQPNVKTLGDAPAMAMGSLLQASSQALANAAYNGTEADQQSNILFQATTTQGVAVLYATDGGLATAVARMKHKKAHNAGQ